jgi:hypothetical protein
MNAGEDTGPADRPPALTRTQTKTLLAAAVAAAQDTQRRRARDADAALLADSEEQARVGAELRQAREAAAAGWSTAHDPDGRNDAFERVALAWASAVTWETLDARAAVTARRLDARLRAAGVHPQIARIARHSDDYAGLALLLARADHAADQPLRATTTGGEDAPQADVLEPEQSRAADIMAAAAHAATDVYLAGRGGLIGGFTLSTQVARLYEATARTREITCQLEQTRTEIRRLERMRAMTQRLVPTPAPAAVPAGPRRRVLGWLRRQGLTR